MVSRLPKKVPLREMYTFEGYCIVLARLSFLSENGIYVDSLNEPSLFPTCFIVFLYMILKVYWLFIDHFSLFLKIV